MTDPRHAGRPDASITDAVPVETAREGHTELPVAPGGQTLSPAGAG